MHNQLQEAWVKRRTNQEKSYSIVQEVISHSTPDQPSYYYAHTILGILYIYEAKYDDAEKILLMCADYYATHDNPVFNARNANNLGMLYILLGDLSKAITHLIAGLEVSKTYDVREMTIFMLYNMAELYKDIQNYEKAIPFLEEAIGLNTNESHVITGAIYSNLAKAYQVLGKHDLALDYIEKSIEISMKSSDSYTLALSYVAFADIYHEIGHYEKAKSYCNKSLEISQQNQDKFSIGEGYMTMAKIAESEKKPLEVIKYCERSLEYLQSIQSTVNFVIIYELMAKASKTLKNLKESIYYFEKHQYYRELQFNQNLENNITILAAEQSIESIKKDAEIYRLRSIELKKKSDELSLISQLGQSLINALDLNEVIKQLYEKIKSVIDVPFLSVGLLDDDQLTYQYIIYDDHSKLPYTVKDTDNSFGYKAIKNNETIYIKNHQMNINDVETIHQNKSFFEIKTLLFCPLYNNQKAIGVLSLQSDKVNAYSEAEIELLKGLSSYIAIAIDNANKAKIISDTAKELKQTLSNLQKTQENLIQAEKLAGLGQLVAGVAHELNTPIGASITMVTHQIAQLERIQTDFLKGILKKDTLEKYIEKTYSTLSSISEAVLQASEMIQSFKNLAITKENLKIRTLPLKSLYTYILSRNKYLLMEKHVKLSYPEDDTEITIYRDIINDIISHLISNSVHHSFKDDTENIIHLVVFNTESNIIIKYRDNGIPIPIDVQKYMFEPFYSTKKNYGLMGIGLHAVHNMVTQILHGTIEYKMGYTIQIPK